MKLLEKYKEQAKEGENRCYFVKELFIFDKKIKNHGIPFRMNTLAYPIPPSIDAKEAREKNFFNYVRM